MGREPCAAPSTKPLYVAEAADRQNAGALSGFFRLAMDGKLSEGLPSFLFALLHRERPFLMMAGPAAPEVYY